MKYEHIDKFAERVGKTRRTIYRFYNRNKDLQEQTKKKSGKRLIPLEHKKYWNPELLLSENKNLSEENHQMKNLLNYLNKGVNQLGNKLWTMEWTYFISIDYKHERCKTYAFSKISKLYDELAEEFGNETVLRLFFTTEPFANRNNGQHNHMMLYIENKQFSHDIMNYIREYFKYDRVDSPKYELEKGGIFYIMKEGSQGIDWDILGNNLEKEGIKYENKGYKKTI